MFGASIQRQLLVLRRPDYSDQRGDRVLLVWQDVPHWMVVDRQMKAFLLSFEQPRRFSEWLAAQPQLHTHRIQLLAVIKSLSQKHILRPLDMTDVPDEKPSTRPPSIENIVWNLTHRCNLRCRCCYYSDTLNAERTAELSAEEVIAFLQTVKPLVSKRCTLTVLGGEPLLHPDKLLAVCGVARTLRIKSLVSTNGTLIDESFARRAKRIGLEVQVSLDGPNAAINDPLRGVGTFDKIRRGVAILRRHDVPVILSMVCCRENFESLQAFLDLAIEWGVPEARFIPLKQMGGAKAESMPTVSHFEIVTRAYQLLRDHPPYRTLLGRDCLSILANTCRYSVRRPSCGTGSQTFLLDADGTLYPCLNLNQPAYAFGNIRTAKFHFAKFWKNSEILDNIRTSVSVHNKARPCSGCLVRYWCLGGCRGETVVNTGNLEAPSIHCGDLRKTILEIFWILADDPGIIKTYEQMG